MHAFMSRGILHYTIWRWHWACLSQGRHIGTLAIFQFSSGNPRFMRRTCMLKGFNYPLTQKGKSTLNPLPPWYYSSDFLNIEFWSEPAAVDAVLAPGLGPDRSADGHANACFYD